MHMDKPVVRDGALLIVRIVLGVIFIAHSWDRFAITGITETTGRFSAANVPQPKLTSWIVAIAEGAGGALLIVGLLTTFVAGALMLMVALGLYFVHLDQGIFIDSTHMGMEYPLVMLCALLIIVVFGSGRASVDGVLVRAEL
ncbi:putative oxidoreductase [Corynebacterium spheniscorum]|uniref:Putative oxidoreductase n=2 Tax=Corynebacterium spheniscorum TaxID=185761 RepID=A0A1I2VBS3_9CORY|nr:putative oxidoreductase [Corynebacterium spheniscorum]